jgi:hypothetical protein
MSCVWRIADSGESVIGHTHAVGSTSDPPRVAQARHLDQPGDRREVHGAKAGNTFSELANLPAQSHVSEVFSISIRGEPLVVQFAAVLFKRFNSITTRNPVQMGFLVTTTHGAATFKSKRGCEKSAELELAAFKTKPRDHYSADRYVLSGVVRPAHAVRP